MSEDDAGDQITCPVPCDHCVGPGACEDCLDCLYWPDPVPPPPRPLPPSGRTSPVATASLLARRGDLGVGARVGLTMRRFRRERELSQRALARRLGWGQTTVARAETDASHLTLAKVDALLRHTRHRLAVVSDTGELATGLDEVPDETWGATDLLARDGQGRRLPPYAEITWNSPVDRRLWSRIVEHEAEWTWHRPRRPI